MKRAKAILLMAFILGGFCVSSFAQNQNEIHLLSKILPKWQIVHAVKTHENYAFLGVHSNSMRNNGISIVDLSNLSEVNEVAFIWCDRLISSVEIKDTYLFVGYKWQNGFNEAKCFSVYDITEPALPMLVRDFQYLEYGADIIKANGNYVYIGDRTARKILIFDISNPSNPVYVNEIATWIMNLDVSESYLYVANAYLKIYDVADPVNPVLLFNDISNSQVCYDLRVRDSMLYGATASGLAIMDVSDPAEPHLLDSVTMESFRGIRLDGDYAYLVSNSRLYKIDVSNSADVCITGLIENTSMYQTGASYVFDVARGYVFYSNVFSGLCAVNTNDPDNMFLEWSYYNKGYIVDLEIVDNVGYVLDSQVGLRLINVRNPYLPYEICCYPLTDYLISIAVGFNTVYISTWNNSAYCIKVLDISDSSNPVLSDSLSGAERISKLYISGESLYAGCNDGLRIYNITNQGVPSLTAFYSTSQPVEDLVVVGNHAFLSCLDDCILVLDVSCLPLVNLAGYWNNSYIGLRHVAKSIDVEGITAYILGYYESNQMPISVRMFVLSILNIQDVSDPELISEITLTSDEFLGTFQIKANNGFLYSQFIYDDMMRVNVKNPDSLVTTVLKNIYAHRFRIQNNILYTASYDYFAIYSIGNAPPIEEISTNLKQNFPNPFRTNTEFRYDLRKTTPVRLSVYNIKGQLVRQIVNEIKEMGSFSVNWDGTDSNNGKVSAGVYFYRLETAEGTQSRKCLLLK